MAGIDVRVTHPQFRDACPSIVAARDCYNGERAVKAKADLYLPRLSGASVEEYAAYKKRATFYSIVGRTVNALTGLAVQGDVVKVGPQEILDQMKDTDHGMQLFEAQIQSVAELLLQGRYSILVDSPKQSQTVGLYGYVSDSVINWDLDATGDYRWVVLYEQAEVVDEQNPYKKTLEDRFRVLAIDPDGVYRVRVFGKDGATMTQQVITPMFNGQTLNYIPFYTAHPDGLSAGVAKSPMEDMVAINLSHYRTSADLEHGRHYCGLPTPVVTGADVASKLRIGGSAAWVLPDKDAKAFYLEFKGEGLASLEKALQEKESQLASLSSSIISRSLRGSESPEAIRLRMSSETASLYAIVKTVEVLLNKSYNTKARIEGYPQTVNLQFPTQFVSGELTADEVQKFSKVYLEGGLSLDSYVSILRRGGALDATRTDADEMAALQERQKAKEDAAKAVLAAKTQPQPQQ